MGERVIFLAHRSEKTATDSRELLACARCRNKAWSVVYEDSADFPRLVCTACQTDGGVIGWAGGEHE
jgi:hypothetical protein